MGEPLKWDGFVSRSSLHDPFTDSAAGIRSSLISNQSRPVSTVSSYHDAISTHTPQITGQTQGYTASQLPSVTPNRQYQPLRNSTVAGSPLDHFRRDSEALLSSGSHQRGSWVNLSRSRSPTPRRDKRDEDEVDEKLDSEGESEDGDELDDLPTQTVQARLPTSTSTALPAADGEKTPSSSVFTQSTASALVETRHFGPAPTGRVLRRHKTKKRVSLTNGNLVVDIPVPPNLVLPRKGDLEVMKMRYTAVTCDPDEFEKNGFFLRQNEAGRKTELFICVTMFNEDEILFCRTLYGVMQNIAHLCSRKNSQTWGNEAWKKVVVCIVADGRKKVHPRVLDCLTLLGVYQPGGHMKNMINNKPVTAHVFEYTTSFALDPNLHFRYPDKGIVPTQIIFCMKEKNQKKINSHRWFFNAFGSMLQPNVCVLLDVGTRPKRKSIYHLWKAFDLNSNVAGACGEIAAYKGKNWSALLNPLVAAQNFEYKISCILDKPTESLFGYISVLPGAFSAYRYIALQNNSTGQGPLASYFKGEVLHGRDTDIFTSNMYLAEDRILCFELVAKANSNWVLRYVKSAVSETDVPDALPEFISQRRRWLNGSFFAATYAIAHVGQMLRSGHSFWRKFALLIQVGYNVLNLISSWFAIGNFYLFFVILTSSLEASTFNLNGIARFNSIVQYIMGSIVIACFLFSMGNKPRSAAWKYKLVSIFLAVLMVYLLAAAVLCAIAASRNGDKAYTVMWFSLIITYGVYIFSSFLAFDPWHMFTSFVPYMLLSPTYVNVLNIYAFSNLDDISWGTKEDNVPDTDLGAVIQDAQSKVDVEFFAEAADANALYEESIQNLKNRTPVNKGNNKAGMTTAEKEQAAKEYYAGVRTNVLLAWVLSNALLLVGILGGSQSTDTFSGGTLTAAKAYLTFVLCFVALTSIIRLSGSTMYLLARVFTG
ncbi:uncharacterized protein STEHIDRAFT_63761 [Stereum hirsutum FP-91666 SS1]|uniref:uncharacterized protein n=1 Tax=Stereum hirsutum (strain FP-91666) TaxID=721885 RepID=UPI00044492D8|nr:uncharacterized protein STEHIDRAFT_63761 [Stereum hirsutum FP-91666 SS1]EIM82816.1 hypothetical protein STEHIDRAFT_63761 [Stereum hirsutum FP-91666 SS1]